MASSRTTETTVISALPWWRSKNNCTIARHDSRKKNYFCSWKEPKGTTSICLPYGSSVCYLSRVAQFESQLLPWPWQGAGRGVSPGRVPARAVTACHRVPLAAWERDPRRSRFSEGANYSLAAQRRCKAHPTALFWSQLRSFPKAAPSPSLWSGALRGGKGGQRNRPGKEQSQGKGTNSC